MCCLAHSGTWVSIGANGCDCLSVLYAADVMAKPAHEPHLSPLHRPSPLPKSRPKQPATPGVLATQLARHLDLSRQRIQQLVDEKVIPQLPSGRFDMDTCRLAYLRWLRAPERRVVRRQLMRISRRPRRS